MENVINFAGLGNFALYFSAALIFLLVFKYINMWLTPYDEWQLIKEKKSTSASVVLSGSLLGYSVAISGVASNSTGFVDFIVWGLVAAVTQFIAMLIVRSVFMPKFVERIENDELAAAIIAASFYISIGILNAACMTY